MVKSRRMRWAGRVARMRERRGAYMVLWGNLREGVHLEDPGVDGKIMLCNVYVVPALPTGRPKIVF